MGGLHPEIGFDHGVILDDLARSPLRDFHALLDHDDVLRNGEDGPHHVLHDERPESDFPLDLHEEGDSITEFLRRETCENFVEQENPSSRPEDPRELEPLSFLDRQVRGDYVHFGLQAHQGENPTGRFEGFRQVLLFVASEHRRDRHIFAAGHRQKRFRDLVGLRDPLFDDSVGGPMVDALPSERDRSFGGLLHACNQVAESRLSRSIRSDEADDSSLLQGQGDALHRSHAAEILVDLRHLEHAGHSRIPRSSGMYFRRVPTMPSGTKRAITTTTRPMMMYSNPIRTVKKIWDGMYTAIAPRSGPRRVPIPQITI